VAARHHLVGRPSRPLSLDGLVAELRRTAADPDQAVALRDAAARRLARLCLERGPAGALVPHADPGRWWGLRARSVADRPLRPTDQPVTLSASALEGLLACPVKWFLEREAGGVAPSSASQAFGQVVHALADRVAKGDFADSVDPLPELMAHVDRVWAQIPFRTPWSRAKERAEVEEALRRFLDWHRRPGARTVLATEQHLAAEVPLPDGQRVRLNGYADRLELDDQGQVVVVDLKTSKQPPLDKELPANAQLGLYQHAVNHGAADGLLGRPATAGGAELVQLRKQKNGSVKVQSQAPQTPGEDGHLEVERQLMQAVAVVRGEALEATPGRHCEHCGFRAVCPVKGAGTVLS
jgi:RecB family exonuclease